MWVLLPAARNIGLPLRGGSFLGHAWPQEQLLAWDRARSLSPSTGKDWWCCRSTKNVSPGEENRAAVGPSMMTDFLSSPRCLWVIQKNTCSNSSIVLTKYNWKKLLLLSSTWSQAGFRASSQARWKRLMGRKKCEIRDTASTLNTWLVVPDFWRFDFSAYLRCQCKGREAHLVRFLCKLFSLVFHLGAASNLRYWLPHAVCWRQEGQTRSRKTSQVLLY